MVQLDDAYNHGLDMTKEYEIKYEYMTKVVGGGCAAGSCDWLTFHDHNWTMNGVIPAAFDINSCSCVVTIDAVDIGEA